MVWHSPERVAPGKWPCRRESGFVEREDCGRHQAESGVKPPEFSRTPHLEVGWQDAVRLATALQITPCLWASVPYWRPHAVRPLAVKPAYRRVALTFRGRAAGRLAIAGDKSPSHQNSATGSTTRRWISAGKS